MLSEIITLGRRIYNLDNRREQHRFIVFIIRSLLHYKSVMCLYKWFQEDEARKKIIDQNPFPIEQMTRAFFYAGSNSEERANLIKQHFAYEQQVLLLEWYIKLNTDHFYKIWQDVNEEKWNVVLHMAPGQRKEGLLAVNMYLENVCVYQIMFWLNVNKKNEASMYIGALQGPNTSNAKEIIKDLTKRSYRYRTKNLILYMTMAVARSLKVRHIYAVSNEGYYANNHVRRDRKLKTDFGQFWQECGGHITHDQRFYELPLIEARKTMEEVPTRKRAVYRKRFAFQDDVDRQIAENIGKILKE